MLTLAAAALDDESIALDIQEAVASLPVLDAAALWQAARSRLSPADSDEGEALHFKQQREGLTAAEKHRLAGLMHQYEKALLIRSHALLLLKERGGGAYTYTATQSAVDLDHGSFAARWGARASEGRRYHERCLY